MSPCGRLVKCFFNLLSPISQVKFGVRRESDDFAFNIFHFGGLDARIGLGN